MIKIAHSFLHKQLFERQNDSICCLLLAEEEKQEPPKKNHEITHTHSLHVYTNDIILKSTQLTPPTHTHDLSHSHTIPLSNSACDLLRNLSDLETSFLILFLLFIIIIFSSFFLFLLFSFSFLDPCSRPIPNSPHHVQIIHVHHHLRLTPLRW